MKLDLTLPAHRSALRWACALVRDCPHASKRDNGFRPQGDSPHRAAVDTLHSPDLAAEALRGLLGWMGTTASVQRSGQPAAERDAVVWIWWTPEDADGPAYLTLSWRDDARAVRYVRMGNLPALFLALLAIPEDAPDRRELALAALREAGR